MIEVAEDETWVSITERTPSRVSGTVVVIVPDPVKRWARIHVACEVTRAAYRPSRGLDASPIDLSPPADVLDTCPTDPAAIPEALREEVAAAIGAARVRLWKRAHDPDADVLIEGK